MRVDRTPGYCGRPSIAKERNFAYLSPIFLASLKSAEEDPIHRVTESLSSFGVTFSLTYDNDPQARANLT
jgi:hypothetical protein